MSALVAAYGLTADNLVAARCGEDAYAMVPKRGGGFFVAMGWCLRGHSRTGTGTASSRIAATLPARTGSGACRRRASPQTREGGAWSPEGRVSAGTPWGRAQHAETYGPGIVAYSTSGHGGFHVAPEANARIHAALRASDGWYEEDCAWAAVALTFGELFTTMERRSARETIRNAQPDAYEAIFATTLAPPASPMPRIGCLPGRQRGKLDRRLRHLLGRATRLHRGCCQRRRPHQEPRRFLIPSGEYEIGRFGFVVDPARYEELQKMRPAHSLAGADDGKGGALGSPFFCQLRTSRLFRTDTASRCDTETEEETA